MGRKIVNSVGVVVTDNDFNIKYISSSASEYIGGENLLTYFKGHPFSKRLSEKVNFSEERLRIFKAGMCYDMYCTAEFGESFCFYFGGAEVSKATYFSRNEDFESVISEIRSRMVMVDTCISILLRAPEQAAGKVASAAKTSIVQIMKIISSCDGIMKADSGRGEARKEEFDIVKLLKRLTDGILSYMNGRFVSFSFRGREELTVYADYFQVQKSVMNIVSCIMANDSGMSCVDIDVSAGKEKAVIRIINDNVTSGKESPKAVFDRIKSTGIYRNMSSVYELELAFAEKSIELNGGTMCANEINGGVCFVIELPMASGTDSLSSSAEHPLPPFEMQLFDIVEMRNGDSNADS